MSSLCKVSNNAFSFFPRTFSDEYAFVWFWDQSAGKKFFSTPQFFWDTRKRHVGKIAEFEVLMMLFGFLSPSRFEWPPMIPTLHHIGNSFPSSKFFFTRNFFFPVQFVQFITQCIDRFRLATDHIIIIYFSGIIKTRKSCVPSGPTAKGKGWF